MMNDDSKYGSSKHELQQLLDAMDSADRATVAILSEKDDRKYSNLSMDRFPQYTSSLDFSNASVRRQSRFNSATQIAAELAAMLGSGPQLYKSDVVDAGSVVVFWANYGIPSLCLPLVVAARYVNELLAVEDDVWLYMPNYDLLVEVHDGHQLTVVEVAE